MTTTLITGASAGIGAALAKELPPDESCFGVRSKTSTTGTTTTGPVQDSDEVLVQDLTAPAAAKLCWMPSQKD